MAHIIPTTAQLTLRADPTPLNLYWKPLRAAVEETQSQTKRGNDNTIQEGEQMQVGKGGMGGESVSVRQPWEQSSVTGFSFQEVDGGLGPMTGSASSASLRLDRRAATCPFFYSSSFCGVD